MAYNTGRAAIYWSWYCSPRRAGVWAYGRTVIGMRADLHDGTLGEYPGWRIMRSQPHQRYGVAGGNRGAKRKIHIVRDQIVAKTKFLPEERCTRWMCGSYTFQAILQPQADLVCSACLLVAQKRSVEPLPKL